MWKNDRSTSQPAETNASGAATISENVREAGRDRREADMEISRCGDGDWPGANHVDEVGSDCGGTPQGLTLARVVQPLARTMAASTTNRSLGMAPSGDDRIRRGRFITRTPPTGEDRADAITPSCPRPGGERQKLPLALRSLGRRYDSSFSRSSAVRSCISEPSASRIASASSRF